MTINAGATIVTRGTVQGALQAGMVLTVINNTSATPINGTFSNLPDGAILTINGNNFRASYEGGTATISPSRSCNSCWWALQTNNLNKNQIFVRLHSHDHEHDGIDVWLSQCVARAFNLLWTISGGVLASKLAQIAQAGDLRTTATDLNFVRSATVISGSVKRRT